MKLTQSLKTTVSIFALTFVILALTSVAFAQSGAPVEPIIVLSNTQAEDPIEFETTRLLVENMRQLGLAVEHKAVPWAQYSDTVWFNRLEEPEAAGGTGWQMTAWRMVARPERMDPDEFVFNLFHSSTAENGYNFVGYNNPEYDALAEQQRGETDQAARQALIHEAQALIADDVPYVYVAHPSLPQLVRTDVWDPESVVDAQGIGIQNFWTWINLTPLTDQRTIITNTGDDLIAINPLYIAGDAPSRITELVWDRLMRIGPDGLAQPWAAESVEWEDDVTVVVTLREGMMWHDGQPVTVEDVKFSFESPNSGESPMYAPFTQRVTEIEIVDDRTLRFTLSEPWVAFEIASLAKVNIIPRHIWEPIINDLMSIEENAEDVLIDEAPAIGSGPFRFVDWVEGESLGLAGESGCGKSTTGKLMVKLIDASDGQIVFDGENYASLPQDRTKAFRRRVQLMFQNPFEALNPRFTLYRSLSEPLLIHGWKNEAERLARILETLDQVNLRPAESFLDKYPHQLSGGQLQRVVLARALVLRPDFLVADEPVSMLDVSVRAGILNTMKRLAKELGLTTVYISHDLSLLQYTCDRIAVMYLGHVVEIGPTHQIINHPQHPYTRALISAVPVPDPTYTNPPLNIHEGVPRPIQLAKGCPFVNRCPEAMDACLNIAPPNVQVDNQHDVLCHLYGEHAASPKLISTETVTS